MVEAVGLFQGRGASAATGMRGAPEEVQMGETFIFSETIKDLMTLRSQLYSAAEYFELAYMQEDGKQAVVSNLKEYAVKALVNTVDHLGSISFKVSSLVGQRLTKRLVSENSSEPSMHEQRRPDAAIVGDHRPKVSQEVHLTSKLRSIARAPSQRARSSSPAQHTRFVPPSDTAIPTKRDKRSDSPISSTTPLTRSGSLSKKPSLLKTSSVRVQTPSDPKRLAPLRSYADRYNDDPKESEQTPKKSKKFLKSLLSRRKSKKEEPLPCYFDDY
ncbi:unnamed protein product [Triticum turgidum subsp. durum]|uniref:Protein ABIL3 n=1 Tax=Triticum turgidum subsp. durum TaxID=4567 RepID=A0A9R0ZH78_TRITD|nr:unnamed protein product [Triticum turgidum subsp. durum]